VHDRAGCFDSTCCLLAIGLILSIVQIVGDHHSAAVNNNNSSPNSKLSYSLSVIDNYVLALAIFLYPLPKQLSTTVRLS